MHSMVMKVVDQASKKPTLSKTEFGSLLIASLKSRHGSKVSHIKKQRSMSNPSLKAIRSAISKKKVGCPSSKLSRKGARSRKLIRGKTMNKQVHLSSPKKAGVSDPRGQPAPTNCSEPNNKSAPKGTTKRKFKRRTLTERRNHKEGLDEPSRLQRRTRYLMIRMKMEQNLIDAYSGEGWKGHSREKIRPEKELLRARKQILKCKLGIRDAIHQLDLLSAVGCIEESVMAADGSVSHEHIFCAKCKSNEVVRDNDIILCDGTCNCAYHQMCLEPPLHTEHIPPGDQGWFCKFCERRMEIIDAMNAHLGTRFSMTCKWKDIFVEEAAAPDGGNILTLQEEWPSDDSADDDYDPERREKSMSGVGTDNNVSDSASSSTSIGWSSDDEALPESKRLQLEGMDFRSNSIYSNLDSGEPSDAEIVNGRRRRRAVDYRKLYDEMFGKDALVADQLSEDEDWGPSKRTRRGKESDAASTLMTFHQKEKNVEKAEVGEGKKELPQDSQVRRALSRIPPNAVEKLRQAFEENELPSRKVKQKLSEELGLEPGKVSKWFKNARYMALKSRKVDKATGTSDSTPMHSGEATDDVKKNTVDTEAVNDIETKPGLLTATTSKDVLPMKKLNSKHGSKENDLSRSQVGNSEMEADKFDDLSLKMLLNDKSKRGKSDSESSSSESAPWLAETEMERLCRAKDTIDKMKQILGSLPISKRRRSKARTLEERVVYVPIAELKEKL
ncbi:Pathogenesis-related homeodomain protein [Linum perenne]